MDEVLRLFGASLISSAVAAAVISIIFKRKTEEIAGQIKNQFEVLSMSQKSVFAWKEKAVAELYGPLYFQFTRTHDAFKRYHEKNLYLEAKILKEGNEKIRNLILEKCYLIPPDLMEDADKLVQHYDVWLEEFAKLRENVDHFEKNNFVFAGPKGFAFPKEAEKNFKKRYNELWQTLYV